MDDLSRVAVVNHAIPGQIDGLSSRQMSRSPLLGGIGRLASKKIQLFAAATAII
jgi:hypothetical protein